MAFKGGTSLSKVFNAIHRFSEDCDVTISYLGFNNNFDPFSENISKNALKKFTEKLRKQLSEYVKTTIAPYFNKQLSNQFENTFQVTVSENGEQVYISYPTIIEDSIQYIRDHILIEFGARNSIDPNNEHTINTYASTVVTDLKFPKATLNVLSPERTFWEKATLIHSECHRSEFRESANRLSRHWSDLAMLSQNKIGRIALSNRDLLADVVKHKKTFYLASHSNYDLCLQGKFRLLPDSNQLKQLHLDYNQMIEAGMFSQKPLSFEEIINAVSTLEKNIANKFG